MSESANLQSSREFTQYQRNAFKCWVMLGSLWALINTCRLAHLLALSPSRRGGITGRQRQWSGQSELKLWFAREWACHLCLPGGSWWGWDKCMTAGWHTERGQDLHQHSSVIPQSFWWERKSRPNTWCPDKSQRLLQHPPLFMCFLLLLKNLKLSFWGIISPNLNDHTLLQNKTRILRVVVCICYTFTMDLKGHVLCTNYTFMAETPQRPLGLFTLCWPLVVWTKLPD